MRQYVVQPGDSPASIAAKMGGCPKCARDLIGANPHKQSVTHKNGFVTFKDLRVNEILNLPEIWEGDNDRRPPEYFKSLPYADGVTFGVGLACRPAPRMRTVADAIGDLSAPAPDSGPSVGAIFVGGLLVASAIAGAIELQRRA